MLGKLFKKLSPKAYIWGILDACVERWRAKYNLKINVRVDGISQSITGGISINPDKLRLVIDPEIHDRKPEETIDLDKEAEDK